MNSRFLLVPGRRIATFAAFLILFLAFWLPVSEVEARVVSADRGPAPQVVQLPPKPSVDLHWKAAASKRGSFRLYRGAGMADLDLIWEEMARPGTHDYSFRDLGSGFRSQVYELRYAEPSGREQVLRTVITIPREIDTGESIATWAPAKDSVLTERTDGLSTRQSIHRVSIEFVSEGLRPEPLVPPPRFIEIVL